MSDFIQDILKLQLLFFPLLYWLSEDCFVVLTYLLNYITYIRYLVFTITIIIVIIIITIITNIIIMRLIIVVIYNTCKYITC